jgi:hypothetical protein
MLLLPIAGITFTTVLVEQPVDAKYVIVVVPGMIPVTTPALLAVATAVLLLV